MSWVGALWGGTHKPWRGLGHRETRGSLAYRHPPVEPALCHRGPPWSARGEALNPVTRPPRLGLVTPQIAC